MKLRYTNIANYVSTAEAVINYAGLRDRIEPIPTRPFEPDCDLGDFNPLGTVPTLIRDDGSALYGGPVIYDYLDTLHDKKPLHPAGGEARWAVLRRAWLSDGIFDSYVRIIQEGWEKVENQRPVVIARQWAKVMRGLDTLEAEAAGFKELDIGQVRAVGAIAFVVLKTRPTAAVCPAIDADYDWRKGRPALSDWFDRVSADPIFTERLLPVG